MRTNTTPHTVRVEKMIIAVANASSVKVRKSKMTKTSEMGGSAPSKQGLGSKDSGRTAHLLKMGTSEEAGKDKGICLLRPAHSLFLHLKI